MRHRYHARSDRCRGPTARPASHMLAVPGVARRTSVHLRFRRRADAKLGAGGAPERPQSSCAQANEQLAVVAVAIVGVQPRPHRRREVDGLPAQVLQQERHPRERSIGQSRGDRGPGHTLLHVNHRCDGLVSRLDCLKCNVQQFVGGDLTSPNQCRQPHPIESHILLKPHLSSVRVAPLSGSHRGRAATRTQETGAGRRER